MEAYYDGIEEMKDWGPPKQQGGYPESYAAFGCTASECGRVGAMAADIQAAGVDQIGGARRRVLRRRSSRQTRGRKMRQSRRKHRHSRKRRHH